MRYARSIGITLVAGISLICSSAALADRGRGGGHGGRHGFSMGHHGGHGGFRGHRGFSRHGFGHHGFNRHRFGHHRFRHHGFNRHRSSIFIGFGGFGWPSYAYGYGYPGYGYPYGYGGYYRRCWTELLWDPYLGAEVPVRRCRY